MHRIDTSTAQKDKFGAGKNGFTLGNAQTGVPPTEVSADILDALQEEICSVVEGSGLALDKGSNSQLLSAIKKLASGRYFNSGQPLPTSNIGPIWHDDYASWMTWQEFTSNGANYRGYASQNIGSLLLDTQPTPRAGYIKSGVQNLSRVTYAALRAWAMHNGLMVAPGIWTAGVIQCADNADGTTFRIYDVRGEFLRVFDDGRGVDAGRVPLSNQADSIQYHSHALPTSTANSSSSSGIWGVHDQYWGQYDSFNEQPVTGHFAGTASWSGRVPGMAGGNLQPETRPRNVALPAAIKY